MGRMPVPDGVGRRREPYIETLRGLACILLVSVHVVGDTDEGLRLPAGSPLHQLIWAFQPVRMPLFAFISGLVFDGQSDDVARLRSKIFSKAHRLLVPLVTVGTAFFLSRSLLHGTPLPEIWRVYFTAYEQFWYLTASFILMVTSMVAMFLLPAMPAPVVVGCWLTSAALYLLDIRLDPDWFSITKAFYLAPFFFLGQLFGLMGFKQEAKSSKRLLIGCLTIAIASLAALRQLHMELLTLTFGQQGFGMLLLSSTVCTFLFITRWEIGCLARIGPYSYSIFLFHLFFTAGTREVLRRFDGLANPHVLFAAGMLAGLAGPILVQRVLLTRPWLAWVLLGQRLPDRQGLHPGVRSGRTASASIVAR